MSEKPKIVFAPGCFDGFEGTQDELNELVAELNRLVETGEIFTKAYPVREEDLTDEEIEAFERMMDRPSAPYRHRLN